MAPFSLSFSKDAASFNSLSGLVSFRAVFCLSALRKTSGWNSSDKLISPSNSWLDFVRSTQFLREAFLLQKPLSHAAGFSGPSHKACHLTGT